MIWVMRAFRIIFTWVLNALHTSSIGFMRYKEGASLNIFTFGNSSSISSNSEWAGALAGALSFMNVGFSIAWETHSFASSRNNCKQSWRLKSPLLLVNKTNLVEDIALIQWRLAAMLQGRTIDARVAIFERPCFRLQYKLKFVSLMKMNVLPRGRCSYTVCIAYISAAITVWHHTFLQPSRNDVSSATSAPYKNNFEIYDIE